MELEKPVVIPNRMFFKIGEVASIAKLKPYVLRFWETEFPFLAPSKSNKQQRMYSRLDVENVLLVKHLLYDQKFSIEGARKKIQEMRKTGNLLNERKPKFQVTSDDVEMISTAKSKLKKMLESCRLDN